MPFPFSETDEYPLPLSPIPNKDRRKGLLFPLLGVLIGVALIAVAAIIESSDQSDGAWNKALLIPEGTAPQDIPNLTYVRVRNIPMEYSENGRAIIKALKSNPSASALLSTLHPEKGERIVSMTTPPPELSALLESGRLPEPDKPEALAGDLARTQSFELDGTVFSVVGRLKRQTGGLTFAMVVLGEKNQEDHFSKNSDATSGWLDTEGIDRAKRKESYFSGDDPPTVVGNYKRSAPWTAWSTLIGLILVASGGSIAQIKFLRRFSDAKSLLKPALFELAERPKLFAATHILLYGVFFGMMFIAFMNPVMSLRAAALISESFSTGSLSYIGGAYASGKILMAAGATLVQNFFIGTLLCTLLPSLIIPFIGLFKNLVSFALVGFVMPPIWMGSSKTLVYHCITMTLEMEAYIVAVLIVIAIPLRMAKGLATKTFIHEVKQAFILVASAACLTAIMLTIAALYEAATLILLNPLT